MKLEDKMDTNDLGGGKPSEWWTPEEKARARRDEKKKEAVAEAIYKAEQDAFEGGETDER